MVVETLVTVSVLRMLLTMKQTHDQKSSTRFVRPFGHTLTEIEQIALTTTIILRL